MELKSRCKNFKSCNAPLCPLDKGSLTFGVWYPVEEICKLKGYRNLPFVVNQRKIQKRAKDRNTYYTYRMLNRSIVIKRGIKGLNPARPRREQEDLWLKGHPGIKKRPEKGGFKRVSYEVNGLPLARLA